MEMNSQEKEVFEFLRRGNSTETIEQDCPPCPDCNDNEIININTLHIKNDAEQLKQLQKTIAHEAGELVDNGNVVVNNDWIVGDKCEIHTPQEVVPAVYAVTSIKNIEASHIPPTFNINPNYPKGCNERNYLIDTQEKSKVVKYANDFNPQFLLNDDNTPANGAIIVDRQGIVLGGNGRTMILQMVISDLKAQYQKYRDLLIKKAAVFGINATKIDNIKYPVLVRIIETNKKKNCNYYSRIFNENMNNKLDELDLAVSYINSLGTEQIHKIASNIANAIKYDNILDKTSLAEVMNGNGVLPYLLQVLKDAKLINHTNYSTYIVSIGKKEKLTESAVPIVRNLFFAMLFENRQTIQYAKMNANIKVERIFGQLIEIKSFEPKFNIMPQLKSAIEKLAILQSTTSATVDANYFYEQTPMFEENWAQRIEYLCMKFIELSDKKQQQKVLSHYVHLVKNLTRGLWIPNQAKVTPEGLLEMAFDEAKVLNVLSNVGNITTLEDNSLSVSDRIVKWFRADFKKPFRWEK